MKLKVLYMILFALLGVWACSDGELEDMYAKVPGQGGGPGGNSGGVANDDLVINGLLESMVRIPGGTFIMGSDFTDVQTDERPLHEVTLSSFYISRYETTQMLWKIIMGTNPSTVQRNGDRYDGRYNSYYQYELDYPVTNVSYNDCQEFIRKLNQKTGKVFALPTEAQWELAARGEYRTDYYSQYGNGYAWEYAPSDCWCEDNSYNTLNDVKSKDNNGFSLYNMSGNVWEWCADYYGAYSQQVQTDPTGPEKGQYRVVRGGSCISPAANCRVAYRNGQLAGIRGDDLGFRLVMVGMMDLNVSEQVLSFEGSGGSRTLTVTTQKMWGCSSSEKWCRAMKSGSELTVNVEANAGEKRSAIITISAGVDEFKVTINQKGESLNIQYNAGDVDTLKTTGNGCVDEFITVKASAAITGWNVVSNQTVWCHVTKSGSTGFKLTVDKNTSTVVSREARIIVSDYSGMVTDTVWVKQAKLINLSLYWEGLTTAQALMGDQDPFFQDIDVRTNAESWTVVSDDSWCTITGKMSNGFRINVEALPIGTSKRNTFVAVEAEGMRDTVWVEQQKKAQVGDYYNEGGIQGIVYEVSADGRTGKIVSLKETTTRWSSESISTFANNYYNGLSNINTIWNLSNWTLNYPAFYWCYNLSSDKGWFLPARDELKAMFTAIQNYGTIKFNNILTANGGTSFSSASYWSSTEYEETGVYRRYAIGMIFGGDGNYLYYKNDSYRVRAIRQVTF